MEDQKERFKRLTHVDADWYLAAVCNLLEGAESDDLGSPLLTVVYCIKDTGLRYAKILIDHKKAVVRKLRKPF